MMRSFQKTFHQNRLNGTFMVALQDSKDPDLLIVNMNNFKFGIGLESKASITQQNNHCMY
jgi:hypothetical protein